MRAAKLCFIVLAAGLLAACGFHLRGSGVTAALPFETLYIALPATSELHATLKRSVEASGKTRVVDDAAKAQVALSILSDVPTKSILSLDASGRVREYQLMRALAFRLSDKTGQDWLPPGQVTARRELAFSDAQVLAKEAEEAVLQRDMQNDLAQQLLRRLATAKPPAAKAD